MQTSSDQNIIQSIFTYFRKSRANQIQYPTCISMSCDSFHDFMHRLPVSDARSCLNIQRYDRESWAAYFCTRSGMNKELHRQHLKENPVPHSADSIRTQEITNQSESLGMPKQKEVFHSSSRIVAGQRLSPSPFENPLWWAPN